MDEFRPRPNEMRRIFQMLFNHATMQQVAAWWEQEFKNDGSWESDPDYCDNVIWWIRKNY